MSARVCLNGGAAFCIALGTACGGGSEGTAPVTPPPTITPAIAISVVPGAVTLEQGSTAPATVTLTRTNYTGAVSLTATGLPPGVSLAGTTTTTGTNADAALAAVADAATATSSVTVTASGTGVASVSAALTLTVVALIGTRVVRQFCGPTQGRPVWVAAQTGTGTWRQLTRGPTDTYTFGVSGTSGLALASKSGDNDYALTVLAGSLADFQHFAAQPCVSPGARTLSATFVGVGSGESGLLYAGRAVGFTTAASNNVQVSGVEDGPVDLVALRRLSSTPTPLKLIIRPSINPAGSGPLTPLDFGGSEAFDPVTFTATVTNPLPGERFSPSAQFQTARGTSLLLAAAAAEDGPDVAGFAVPGARTASGDVQSFLVAASATPTLPSASRAVLTMYRVPQDRSVTLGPPLGPVTASVVSTSPYVRVSAQYARQSEYSGGTTLFLSQLVPGGSRSAFVQLMGAGEFDRAIPDFSAVAGWSPVFGIQPGTPVIWNLIAYTWTGAPLVGTFPTRADGVLFRQAGRAGMLSP